jgi:dihydrolipoamide dehydrogenase
MVVGEFTKETQLLIIGGGPGGYTTAFRAAELGIETTVVDPRAGLGGVCLFDGCIPSKTLLDVARTISQTRRAADAGIHFGEPTIDLGKLRAWVDRAVDTLSRGLESTGRKREIAVIRGTAHFEDDRHASIPGAEVSRIKFRRVVIATGNTPDAHPLLPFDGIRVLRPHDAAHLPRIPERLLVLGGGFHGVELASIYATLGSAVTLVTADPRLVPHADADLSRPLERSLKTLLADVAVGTTIEAADVREDGVSVTWDGKAHAFDHVVVALGARPDFSSLQLPRIGVQPRADGYLDIDQKLQTANPRVYAVGDITGPPCLADKAIHQGRIAAQVIAGWGSLFDARVVPRVIFTDPQVAWVGLTETQAKAEGIDVGVQKIPWGASGRAVGMGRTDGLTKILYEPDTKLVLGVGITGTQAAEMISEGALAIEMGAELADLAGTIHPHPTMSEMMSDAAFQAEA